jgi:hypothetical protein
MKDSFRQGYWESYDFVVKSELGTEGKISVETDGDVSLFFVDDTPTLEVTRPFATCERVGEVTRLRLVFKYRRLRKA